MPSASSASSSHSSATATLGLLSLSSGVASPPLYMRHCPSASSYLSPSRRCSRPQGEKAIKARVHRKGRKKSPFPPASLTPRCPPTLPPESIFFILDAEG
ncbi:hypothetical protein ACQJBY_015725 [Aegilops geniculata]